MNNTQTVQVNEKLLHYVRLSDILSEMPSKADKHTRKLVDSVFCPHLSAVGAVYYIPLSFLMEVVRGHDRQRTHNSTTEALDVMRKIHASNAGLSTLMVDLGS